MFFTYRMFNYFNTINTTTPTTGTIMPTHTGAQSSAIVNATSNIIRQAGPPKKQGRRLRLTLPQLYRKNEHIFLLNISPPPSLLNIS